MRCFVRLASVLALASAVHAGCGGATPAAPGPPLGVQSNEAPFTPIVLRVAPEVGSRLRLATRVEARARFLDRPITLEYETRELRTVTDRRPDGTTVFSTRTLGGETRMGMGPGAPRAEPIAADDVPRTTVMDARGTTVEDALFAPAPAAPRERRERFRAFLDPIVAALAYPTTPLALRDRWGTRGTRPASDLGEGATGDVDFEITSELVRVEGTGPDAIAVVALRGALSGAGSAGGDRLSGTVQLEGLYTVALADGLVRSLEVRAQGGLRLAIGVEVPLEGVLRYRAEP
jgi:hypothetical protein